MIIAILPAHQEEAGIAQAIESLKKQTIPPNRIIVAADNCTDRTAELATQAGAEVFTTVDNIHRKAGAINQAFSMLTFEFGDKFLIMDADTTLSPNFIEVALLRFEFDKDLAAVGGVFTGSPASWLEQAQANEWTRYARQLRRTGKVQVLSGTAAVIRMEALDEIRFRRGNELPGKFGDVYHTDAATEDFCLTVALKTLGYRMASPSACQTVTELMPSVKLLWAQRTRWYGGALQVLGMYGPRRSTLSYFGQQIMLGVSVIGMMAYLLLTGILASSNQLGLSPWIALGTIFWVERVVTVWSGGQKARLLAALMIPEILYDIFLQAAFVISAVRRIFRKPIAWHHISVAKAV